ncbi:hypothetical protein V1T76_28600 [Roseibium sp. FZY0029]|jgi:hypothetical protein|uniref:hypothetical protein n=1 Tax=Roseibium TaxID=150830 RepID=UPI001E3BF011|nr:hypothetical protein [Roseibium aggregatum]MEE4016051.1 hypothetical protein [Roseibium sp. FZY0029]UES53997.1 hypothetical protein GFK88_29895 [Roseibium aggregatum]
MKKLKLTKSQLNAIVVQFESDKAAGRFDRHHAYNGSTLCIISDPAASIDQIEAATKDYVNKEILAKFIERFYGV